MIHTHTAAPSTQWSRTASTTATFFSNTTVSLPDKVHQCFFSNLNALADTQF